MVRILDVGEKVLDLFDRLPAPIGTWSAPSLSRGLASLCWAAGCRWLQAGPQARSGAQAGAVDGFKAVRAQRGRILQGARAVGHNDRCHPLHCRPGMRCTLAYKARQQAERSWRAGRVRPRRPKPRPQSHRSALEPSQATTPTARSPLPGSASTRSSMPSAGARVVRQVQGSVDGVLGRSRTSTASRLLRRLDHRTRSPNCESRREAPGRIRQIMLGLLDQLRPGKITDGSTRTSSRP